jgi:hypothetical protein
MEEKEREEGRREGGENELLTFVDSSYTAGHPYVPSAPMNFEIL